MTTKRKPKLTVIELTPEQAEIVAPLLKKANAGYNKGARIIIAGQLHDTDDLAYGYGPRDVPFIRLRACTHEESIILQAKMREAYKK